MNKLWIRKPELSKVVSRFYVGGLSGEGTGKVVNGNNFIESDLDPLRFDAVDTVNEWNQ